MKQRRPIPGWISPLTAFLFLACIVAILINGTREQPPTDEALARVQQAISRAAVQCYALEGAYPPDLQYLRDNYNLIIDDSRYYCEIETFGSNVRPNVIVAPLGGTSG